MLTIVAVSVTAGVVIGVGIMYLALMFGSDSLVAW